MKAILKGVVRCICSLCVLPLVAQMKLLMLLTRRKQPFQTGSEVLSLIPGLLGIYLRREYFGFMLKNSSNDCCIEFGTCFSNPNAAIGKRAYIGQRCNIGYALIGDDVLIGSNIDILSGRRQHATDRSDVSIMDQGGEFTAVSVGNGSWIGNRSVIMADIGENCVIGAGSVVVHPIESNCVAVGNPARVVKQRQASAAVDKEGKL